MTGAWRAEGIRLAATPTAVSCARLFVVSTLTRWGARSVVSDAVLVAENLVATAVKATGVLDTQVRWTQLAHLNVITVHLLGRSDSIRIEVWDSAPTLPLLPDNAAPPVTRGCHSTAGGKVVWAQLPLLPQRRTTNTHPQPTPEQFTQDPDLLHRALNGLKRL